MLCRTVASLRAALPELLADDRAAKSVLDAPGEREAVERLEAVHPRQEIRTGRRGRPPVVTFDPSRLQRAADFLSRHLGVPVALEAPPAPRVGVAAPIVVRPVMEMRDGTAVTLPTWAVPAPATPHDTYIMPEQRAEGAPCVTG